MRLKKNSGVVLTGIELELAQAAQRNAGRAAIKRNSQRAEYLKHCETCSTCRANLDRHIANKEAAALMGKVMQPTLESKHVH